MKLYEQYETIGGKCINLFYAEWVPASEPPPPKSARILRSVNFQDLAVGEDAVFTGQTRLRRIE
jgi:hypothetical protein